MAPSTLLRPLAPSAFRRVVVVSLCFLFAVVSSDASAPSLKKRTALVIGNEHYEASVGRLRNPDNDAKAVAQALRALGFAVIERHDLTRDQLLRTVDAFRKTLPGAEVALFYYAGHGLSVAGENYLVPLKSGFAPGGADGTTLRMLAETRLFNVEEAVADMGAAGAACNLVILDACRTLLKGAVPDRGWAGRDGLVEMTPPANSLIAFATDEGQTAFDGDGSHGLYTEELLKQLRTPGLTIEQVFKRTRSGVLHRSGGEQLPAEYSRLVGDDIYLAGEPPPEILVERAEPVAATSGTNPAPLSPKELLKLAVAGRTTECISGLEVLARSQGPGDYAIAPLDAMLERVKDDLKDATVPSSKIVAAEATCASVLRILPGCLPSNNPRSAELAAKAYNRRGDALLILGKPQDAAKAYDAAATLAPKDAYVLYNRGRARLALGLKDQAKADFTAAAGPNFDQPKARKLAQRALAELN